MRKNILMVAGEEIKIPPIVISSWLSQVTLEDEFTFTIDVYVPKEENAAIFISFDHIIVDGCQDIQELIGREVYIDSLDKDKYLSNIQIADEEYESLWLKFSIKSESNYWIVGDGTIRRKDGAQELNIHFEGLAHIEDTEIIEYVASENYQRTHGRMVELLTVFGLADEQLSYKQAVPFVHIPYELIEQWRSVYQPDHKWFVEEYTPEEVEELEKIENLINNVLKTYNNQELADVPDILKNKLWQELMAESWKVKQIIEKAIP